MYCHVQAEQDNKAQITGTNGCPLKLSNFIFELPRALCTAHTSTTANSPLYYLLTTKQTPGNISSVLAYDLATTSPQYSPYICDIKRQALKDKHNPNPNLTLRTDVSALPS